MVHQINIELSEVAHLESEVTQVNQNVSKLQNLRIKLSYYHYSIRNEKQH